MSSPVQTPWPAITETLNYGHHALTHKYGNKTIVLLKVCPLHRGVYFHPLSDALPHTLYKVSCQDLLITITCVYEYLSN